MVQVIEHLYSKLKALSSNSRTAKKKFWLTNGLQFSRRVCSKELEEGTSADIESPYFLLQSWTGIIMNALSFGNHVVYFCSSLHLLGLVIASTSNQLRRI
jgi:hypothetical protein